ncbi:MAG: NAD-dependent epimerase/dehydratase family protein [Nostocaceae cyanobacterium]|nr:NAD-dependent epimerase/dehydratase family protein [Nostocaceae cyanobacterium]
MRIFVTGGSGFLGQRLIKRLIDDGNFVGGLARSNSSGEKIEKLGAEVVRGSLENVGEWENELQGYDVVIHCAAPVEFWGVWSKFENEITLATKNLLMSSSKMHVKRFIYISSESVLQDVNPLVNIDESFPYPDEPNSYYGKAKKLAEQEILSFTTDMKCIILRPTYIWGTGDKTPQKLVEKVKSGQFMWVDNGQCVIETVHVDNLVEAICLACVKGNDKQVYMVTDDEPITVKDYFTQVLKIQGVTPPNKNIPSFIAKPLATAIEFIWKLFGIKGIPPLYRFELSFVAMPRKYNIAKIKRELGYQPVVTREMGLQEL